MPLYVNWTNVGAIELYNL